MRLNYTNKTISIKRRTTSSGNKKADTNVQTGISAFMSDTGTTSDHEQTYLIMLNAEDITSDINADTDTVYDGTSTYKIENSAKKEYHYEIRAIKIL